MGLQGGSSLSGLSWDFGSASRKQENKPTKKKKDALVSAENVSMRLGR